MKTPTFKMASFEANIKGNTAKCYTQKVLDENENLVGVDIRSTYIKNGEENWGQGFRVYDMNSIATICKTLFYCLDDEAKNDVLAYCDKVVNGEDEQNTDLDI